MPHSSSLGISSPECERLEADFLDARSRLQLIDRVAMAIARIKEHEATHGREACEKGMAAYN